MAITPRNVEQPMKPINKVVYGEQVLIDLTEDTVVADKMLSGFTAHDKSGATITGTCTFDADTRDATSVAEEILAGKTGYVNAVKVTGTMPNKGAVTGDIATKDQLYTIPLGYHNGEGKIGLAAAEKEKLIAANIRTGISLLGITGTMDPLEGVKAQTKNVTPKLAEQVIIPDGGNNYLSQVTVAAIPTTSVANDAGGMTFTIGAEVSQPA